MNFFKKLSLKYFNGSADLKRNEQREILTSRDKAFIYACRKYNLEFEYLNFFSGAHFVEESDFEPEHSLIKCKFSELQKHNHFEWFVYLLCRQLDKERIPQFKAVLKLIEGKREDYFRGIVDTMRRALSNNFQQMSPHNDRYTNNLWNAGLNYAIETTVYISILWDSVDAVLDYVFYKVPEEARKYEEQERIRKQKEQEDYARRYAEWHRQEQEQERERRRQEEERVRRENAQQRARYGYSDGFYNNQRSGFNWDGDDFGAFNSQSRQWRDWWEKFYKEQQERESRKSQSQSTSESSLYTILQIEPTTDKKVIKAAYRKLVLVYHPDRGGSEEKFKELTAAYEKLMSL